MPNLDSEPGNEAPSAPAADDAWKVFGAVNDWIRHADNKVGVTLAASGAVGVMLYNLVRALPPDVSGCAYLAPVLCGLALALAVVLCATALNPRIDPSDSVENPSTLATPSHLYFGDISTRWKREPYVRELADLVADPSRLIRELASQTHVNAHIAAQKMAATKRAVFALSVAVVALSVTAVVVVLHS